jgi:GR25 family glycosyltransferase involved in LPS biosynthesis
MTIRLQPGLPAVIINMDGAAERWEQVSAAFRAEASIVLRRHAGVLASPLPDAAFRLLNGRAPTGRGALGCFLAHCALWEGILRDDAPWTLVLEDDAAPRGLPYLFQAELPEDADLVWTSVRGDPAGRGSRPGVPRIAPLVETLRSKAGLPVGPAALGTDGYLLSRAGAAKLLAAVAKDRFSGHVDWRLVRYGLAAGARDEFVGAPWFAAPQGLDARRAHVGWGILNAYACSPAVTRVAAGAMSVRRDLDLAGRVASMP